MKYKNLRGSLIGSTFHCIERYVGLGEARIWGVRGSFVRLRIVWLTLTKQLMIKLKNLFPNSLSTYLYITENTEIRPG